MKRKPKLTERERFTAFVEKHAPKRVDAFWWCRGEKWSERQYCVVLLASTQKDSRVCEGMELFADTAEQLAEKVKDVGYKATAWRVRRNCEEHFHKFAKP